MKKKRDLFENKHAKESKYTFSSEYLLEKGLAQLQFPLEDTEIQANNDTSDPIFIAVRGQSSIIKLLKHYIRELELFNAVFDLVGVETGTEQGRSELIVRHILDSLAPWRELISILGSSIRGSSLSSFVALKSGDSFVVADAGSGAGLPGIPLAIVFPKIHFVLVERMSKRCSFLENCAALMGLSNVQVLNEEVERAPIPLCDLVVFRAFRPLEQTMLLTLFRLAVSGGFLAAWKGKRNKIEEEMYPIQSLTSGWKALPVTVPFLEKEERHLVVMSLAESPNPLK